MSRPSVQPSFWETPSKDDVNNTISRLSIGTDHEALKDLLLYPVDDTFRTYEDRHLMTDHATRNASKAALHGLALPRIVASLNPAANEFMTGRAGTDRTEAWTNVENELKAIKVAYEASRSGKDSSDDEAGQRLNQLTGLKATTDMADRVAILTELTVRDMRKPKA